MLWASAWKLPFGERRQQRDVPKTLMHPYCRADLTGVARFATKDIERSRRLRMRVTVNLIYDDEYRGYVADVPVPPDS